MSERILPAFETESDEARWWFEHRAEIADDLIAASRSGDHGEGSMARRSRKLREIADQTTGSHTGVVPVAAAKQA